MTHDEQPSGRALANGDFAPVDLTSTDYARLADLVDTYESLPLGVTDASDAAIVKPLGLTDVARAMGKVVVW